MNFHLKDIIPFFEDADEEIEKQFQAQAVLQKFNKGNYLTLEGDNCYYFPILKSGLVRVYKMGSNGHELTLYRINPGESCILTISCLLSNDEFPAVAYVEKDSEVILIPAGIFNSWIKKYPKWNEYTFNYLTRVINKVITLLEEIRFRRTDLRIIEKLVNLSLVSGSEIHTTHQHLADDIGTAREVVSRILKDLEKKKYIAISRGKIEISDLNSLKKLLKELQ